MTIIDQVLNQAELLAGEMDERLRLMCTVTVGSLSRQLREETAPEDIREEFVAAASLLAYARWSRGQDVQEFRAGDLTVKKGQAGIPEGEALALLAPYLKSGFVFLGV